MKTIFALAALLSFSAVSFATSVQPYLLNYTEKPLPSFQSDTAYVRVQLNGDVIGGVVSRVSGKSFNRKLATINPDGLREIGILVERSQKGALVGPATHGPMCAAVPQREQVYTAKSGLVRLEIRQVPCGAPRENDTRSALRLVQILDHFVKQLDR